jgi:hypothetical protein
VPRNIRLAEAPSHGIPVLQYDIKSRGAQAYLALAREILPALGATADAPPGRVDVSVGAGVERVTTLESGSSDDDANDRAADRSVGAKNE